MKVRPERCAPCRPRCGEIHPHTQWGERGGVRDTVGFFISAVGWLRGDWRGLARRLRGVHGRPVAAPRDPRAFSAGFARALAESVALYLGAETFFIYCAAWGRGWLQEGLPRRGRALYGHVYRCAERGAYPAAPL